LPEVVRGIGPSNQIAAIATVDRYRIAAQPDADDGLVTNLDRFLAAAGIDEKKPEHIFVDQRGRGAKPLAAKHGARERKAPALLTHWRFSP
jgi:hypothetical protein